MLTKKRRFAEKCCPKVVSAFAYVWHPDALDTFDNYFSSNAHFSDIRENLWTTTVTIPHWRLVKNSNLAITPVSSDQFHEGELNANRKDGIFSPEPHSIDGVSLEERSSSLVITGDSQGYHWMCSIWSSLLDGEAVQSYTPHFRQVLHLFIHMEATSRCLIFLIILGHICEKLAHEYSRIVKYLDSVAELGVSYLK